jgi:hypothetical protein
MNDLAERVVDRDLPTVLDAQGSRCPLTAARVADAPRPGRCRLANDADRAPSDQDRHWLESLTGELRGQTGDLRGLWFLRPTRKVRTTGRIESSPTLPGTSRVRPRRS